MERVLRKIQQKLNEFASFSGRWWLYDQTQIYENDKSINGVCKNSREKNSKNHFNFHQAQISVQFGKGSADVIAKTQTLVIIHPQSVRLQITRRTVTAQYDVSFHWPHFFFRFLATI